MVTLATVFVEADVGADSGHILTEYVSHAGAYNYYSRTTGYAFYFCDS